MDWEHVIAEHYKKYERSYLVCENEPEREFLVNLLKPILKEHTRTEIDTALGYACRTSGIKNDLKNILDCVEENVGKV